MTSRSLGGTALVYLLGSAVSALVGLGLLPVFTHHLSPAEFGAIALATSLTGLATSVLSMGSHAVVHRYWFRFRTTTTRNEFIGGYWVGLLGTSAVLLISVATLGLPSLTRLAPELTDGLVTLSLLLAWIQLGFIEFTQAIHRIRGAATALVAIGLTQTLIGSTASLALVLLVQGGAEEFLIGQLIGFSCAAILGVLSTRDQLRPHFPRRPFLEGIRFGAPLVAHRGSHWVLELSDRALLSHFTTPAHVGVYSIAYRLGSAVRLAFDAADQALTPAFGATIDRTDSPRLVSIITRYLAFVGLSGTLGLTMITPLVLLALPRSYHASIDAIPFVVLAMVARALYVVPLKVLTLIRGATGRIPLLTGLAATSNVLVNVALIPKLGVVGAAVGTLVGYSVLASVTSAAAGRYARALYDWRRLRALYVLFVTASFVAVAVPANAVFMRFGVAVATAIGTGLIAWRTNLLDDDHP